MAEPVHPFDWRAGRVRAAGLDRLCLGRLDFGPGRFPDCRGGPRGHSAALHLLH